MKMKEIAERINAHLKRFEADPEINTEITYHSNRTGKQESAGHRFYYAGAYYHRGPKVSVTYISYQGHSNLSKDEALRYLEWLDAGNVGRHYEAFEEA